MAGPSLRTTSRRHRTPDLGRCHGHGRASQHSTRNHPNHPVGSLGPAMTGTRSKPRPSPDRLAPKHQLGIPQSFSRPPHQPRTPHSPSQESFQYPSRTPRYTPRTHQARTRGHHCRSPRILPRRHRTPRSSLGRRLRPVHRSAKSAPERRCSAGP